MPDKEGTEVSSSNHVLYFDSEGCMLASHSPCSRNTILNLPYVYEADKVTKLAPHYSCIWSVAQLVEPHKQYALGSNST